VPFGKHFPHLHPRQMRAKASVRPATERKMQFLATEVDLVSVRVLGRWQARYSKSSAPHPDGFLGWLAGGGEYGTGEQSLLPRDEPVPIVER
jgi:hypothetical protein